MTRSRTLAGSRWPLAIFVLLATGLVTAGVTLQRERTRHLVRLHRERMETAARLLSAQLARWRQERLADAHLLSLASEVAAALESPGGKAGAPPDLLETLEHIRQLYGYEAVTLLDRDGRPRVATPLMAGPHLDPHALPRDPPLIVEDRDTHHGHVHVTAVAEVVREGRALGFVALTSAGGDAVGAVGEVPLSGSRTDAAWVLTEQGGTVVPLAGGGPGSQDVASLLPAVLPALRDGWGFVETEDGTGREVLAVAGRVPASPWFVLVKIDRAEALALGGGGVVLPVVLIGLLVALAGVGTHLLRVAERRVAERRVDASRRRHDLLFQNALSGVAVHELVRDEAGRAVDSVLLEVNPAFERLTGLPREKVSGRRVSAVLPGIAGTPFIEAYGRVVSSGEAQHMEEYVAPLDRYYEVNAFPLGGDLFGTIVADATPRRRTESALRESERNLRAIFDGALDPIFVADDEGRWVDVNPAAARALGATRAELVGRTVADFVPDPGFDHGRAWEAFLDAGQMTGVIELRRRDGEVRTFEFAATARVAPGRHVSLLRDVTRKVEAERTLKGGESLFRLVLETIPVGVWLLDREGRITYGNPAARRIWGGARFVGRDEFEVFKAWRLPGREPLAGTEWSALKALDKGVAIYGEALEIEPFDGGRRQIVSSTLPIRDEEGTVVGALITNEDVTEQKRLELHSQQSQKMEAVGRLAGGVAHDFNNLLAIIEGRALALRRLLPEGHEGARHLGEVLEATERATALTRQLLAFGRKQVLQRRPVRVDDVVERVRPMLERLLGEDVRLSVERHEGAGTVLADLHQLEQVLVNLAVNARDAMPDGGTLTIATSGVVVEGTRARWRHDGLEPGRYVLVSVADTGEGMDRETREQIFEPFFTTKEAGRGTGLGLSTVFGIVSQNGGHVAVASELGKGSTFRVYLPVSDEAVVVETGAGSPAAPVGGTETLLVVEDEGALRSLIQEDLEELGYTVLAAGTPAEALGLAASHSGKIDLVLTDVILPNMNGRELLARLKGQHPDAAAVYMSGYTADVIARHGVLEPAIHFLEKPFLRQELAARIREALEATSG